MHIFMYLFLNSYYKVIDIHRNVFKIETFKYNSYAIERVYAHSLCCYSVIPPSNKENQIHQTL